MTDCVPVGGQSGLLFSCVSSEHSAVGVLASSACPSLYSPSSSAVRPLRLTSASHQWVLLSPGSQITLASGQFWSPSSPCPIKMEEEQRLRSRSLFLHSSLWVSFRPGLYPHLPGHCPCKGRALLDSLLPGLRAVRSLGPSGLGAHGFTAANPGARHHPLCVITLCLHLPNLPLCK